ncbi:myogenesis-regulating glycosidase isoform X3 [Cherax quadricarinatus]|nr:myogenesis-regulating glycosidase-like isoform X3 [Cherax quadricarinatus]XP_053655549.1 myogenesis-regulating glycosidase-like isoform X3 [Cherax quadricarinatus]XP_053655550.1 myogenesis-regulating glycosidase-like isoform X3 [Cherax quadricarinatus]
MVVGVCGRGVLLQLNSPYNTLTIDPHTIHFTHTKGEAHVRWGLTLPEGIDGEPCGEGDACLDFGVAKVVVTTEEHCQKVSWVTTNLTELKDCVSLEGHWYGGGEQVFQPWPIEKEPRDETAFITADMLQNPSRWYGGLTEAYWISSIGVAVRVEETTPLFVSVPDYDDDTVADELCLAARQEQPYVAAPYSPLTLDYFLCSAEDVRKVHEASYPKFFSLPESVPDARMMEEPIWSTWAQYKTHVNVTRVMDFAREITNHGFNNSQVEIDDNWENCYGNAVFNPDRFPDPKAMVDQLHSEGFRVTLWIHPFINDNCEAFEYADQHGYFIKDSEGQTQKTHWWQGSSAGIIDFSNEEAVAWWSQRLLDLREKVGIDSFKFDAGEASWLPDVYTLSVDERFWPNAYTQKYIDTVSQFGGMIEARVGRGTQRHNIFIRMLDKDSIWGSRDGLRSLIPSLLHSGILGYPFVLPDMVGGNGYLGLKPGRQLFVRWAQANAFMPAIQFSLLPWDYDEEVTELSLEVTRLHSQMGPLLQHLAEEATTSVAPIARPTWWLCPDLESCLTADQQFLLGDDLLVVPVVEDGATTLKAVVPPGSWLQAGTDQVIEGPVTLSLDDITLESIVYFTRQSSNNV